MDGQLAATLLPFLLSVPRLAAVFIVLPLFGRRTLQGLIRNEFILVLALFIYPVVAHEQGVANVVAFQYVALAIKEAFIGVTFGFFLGTFFWVAENVGYLIDLQTGTHNMQIYDPISDHEQGPTAGFMLHFVVVMMFAGGGLLTILDLLFESYRLWPVLDMGPSLGKAFEATVAARADTLFSLTVRYAAPVVMLLVLIELGLGLINRFSQNFDAYTMAMPIKSLVAFFVLLLFLSFVYDSLQYFFGADNGALRLLQEALR
jgi:type III secretion protein T